MSARAAPARNSIALARASSPRSPGAESTHQSTETSAPEAIQVRIVPPAPISMSSECAPIASTRSALPGRARSSASILLRLLAVAVDLPGHVALLHHVLEHLPVAQRIHRTPEARVLVGHELVL